LGEVNRYDNIVMKDKTRIAFIAPGEALLRVNLLDRSGDKKGKKAKRIGCYAALEAIGRDFKVTDPDLIGEYRLLLFYLNFRYMSVVSTGRDKLTKISKAKRLPKGTMPKEVK
jgi:hypothetical protein